VAQPLIVRQQLSSTHRRASSKSRRARAVVSGGSCHSLSTAGGRCEGNRLRGAPRPFLDNDIERDCRNPDTKEPLQFCRAHPPEPSAFTPFAASDRRAPRLGQCSGMTPECPNTRDWQPAPDVPDRHAVFLASHFLNRSPNRLRLPSPTFAGPADLSRKEGQCCVL
jgi:hypothetical protein